MKKKFFLCLIEIVSLTCMGHAAVCLYYRYLK